MKNVKRKSPQVKKKSKRQEPKIRSHNIEEMFKKIKEKRCLERKDTFDERRKLDENLDERNEGQKENLKEEKKEYEERKNEERRLKEDLELKEHSKIERKLILERNERKIERQERKKMFRKE